MNQFRAKLIEAEKRIVGLETHIKALEQMIASMTNKRTELEGEIHVLQVKVDRMEWPEDKKDEIIFIAEKRIGDMVIHYEKQFAEIGHKMAEIQADRDKLLDRLKQLESGSQGACS